MVRLAFPLIAIFGFASAALAADPPAAQQSASARTAMATPAFLEAAAAGNTFEIDSSRLALERSNDADVKRFAQHMIDDHTKAGEKLKAAVQEAGLQPPPQKLDSKHQNMLDNLRKAQGGAFDKAYIDAQTTAHVETVNLFKNYAQGGDNARIKQFASDLLPTLQSHLDQVKKLQ
ncbi:MAG: DUF4142 domain-containing protein [Pseudomonadota bacterium]